MCRKEPGMKINRVTLYNFSSYVGENTIALGTHNEQNIILIGGNNGAGKTSFFTAIKLALYGPQCFRFQDKNNRYTARIKELINHDAFLSDNVKAYVEVEIDLPTDRVHTLYTIRREWSFIEKRLHENYTVYKEHQLLADKNLDFFQNYLFSIIPPNLFDFFFFDGEEIGDFFATGNYSNYIKNAVLTLSGYDTLYPFIQHGGRMRIVCSVNVSPEDEHQIALGYDIRQLLEDKIAPATQELIDLNIANIKNLCWLIKNNRLDIKVCLRKDPNTPGAYRLFHEKFGIFKDADENAVSFLGSVNETLGGWINNEESFEVSQNWIPVLQPFWRHKQFLQRNDLFQNQLKFHPNPL